MFGKNCPLTILSVPIYEHGLSALMVPSECYIFLLHILYTFFLDIYLSYFILGVLMGNKFLIFREFLQEFYYFKFLLKHS